MEPVCLVASVTAADIKLHSNDDDDDDDGNDTVNICFELRLQPDLDYLLAEDMAQNLSFADIVGLLVSKQNDLTMIGLGAGVDLSEEFIASFESPSNKSESEVSLKCTRSHQASTDCRRQD